jgi:hypothetical protein
MAVVGPRHPLKESHRAGRELAAGLASRAGHHVSAHSATYAVALAVASVAWGLQQLA